MFTKDRVILGAIIGLLADAVKLTVNYAAYVLGFTDVVFWQIVAANFLAKELLFEPLAIVIGAIGDLTVTATLGVVFVYTIRFIGNEYIWIKGVGFAMLVWVGLFGTVLGSQIDVKLPQSLSGVLVTVVAHVVFGLSLAFFTKRIVSDKPEKKEPMASKSSAAPHAPKAPGISRKPKKE